MRLIRIALLQFLPVLAIGAGPTLQVLGLDDGDARRVIALPDGGTLVIGTEAGYAPPGVMNARNGRRAISLVKSDVSGKSALLPVSSQFGHGNDVPADAAIDQNGNIWVGGATDSDDFPLVSPLVSQKMPYRATGFVTKLDPTGSKILFSSFLGGRQETSPLPSSQVTNLAIDSSGNVYILGNTTEADFPQTSGVLGSGSPTVDSFGGARVYTFVVKISPDGRLMYSVLLGADKINCSGGSHCIGKAAQTIGNGISVEASGNVTIAGSTNASNFPATAQAFEPRCACPDFRNVGFVARVSATGKSLVWATYLGYTGSNTVVGAPGSTITALALDSVGNAYVAGTEYGDFPTTSGVIQSTVSPGGPNIFASKLTSDGSSLLYSTYLGGSKGATLRGLALDSAGRVWIAGSTTSPDFPSLDNAAQLGTDFALQLNADATALVQSFRLPSGTVTQNPVLDSNGNLLLLAFQGTLVRLSPTEGLSGAGVLGFGNAASLRLDTGVNPGELVTIFGVGLGPAPGISGLPDSGGSYPTQLGGVQVLVGSKPAPLLYAGPNQINFQVPFQFYPYTLQVITAATTLAPIQIAQRNSLGLFRLATGSAAALNQDGSVNSAANPAAPGSVVSLFATGLEQSLLLTEGTIWPGPNPFSFSLLNIKVTTSLGGGSLPILYAGAAPGLINGVTQLNVQLPLELKDPLLTLTQPGFSITSSISSNAVRVYAH
ncbi:MAG: SBBP repeat-containing protein [Acidobacteriota bacterium]|nr:SBBP repeat-containing protein [Acidobacteriota bacterium]